jgi:hypothetical protein
MAAIEYGSYYWCVILDVPGGKTESVHLHADEVSVEKNGALTFRSAGRRPAGAEPGKAENHNEEKNYNTSSGGDESDKPDNHDNDDDKDEKPKHKNMIYMAFAPGSWRIFYAAKLQDGAPASVEHWNVQQGRLEDAPLDRAVGATLKKNDVDVEESYEGKPARNVSH